MNKLQEIRERLEKLGPREVWHLSTKLFENDWTQKTNVLEDIAYLLAEVDRLSGQCDTCIESLARKKATECVGAHHSTILDMQKRYSEVLEQNRELETQHRTDIVFRWIAECQSLTEGLAAALEQNAALLKIKDAAKVLLDDRDDWESVDRLKAALAEYEGGRR